MRIPFDTICLAAILHELQDWIGARIQKVVQNDPYTVRMQLYLRGEAWLTLSGDAMFHRIHLSQRRSRQDGDPPAFGKELKARLLDSRLIAAQMVGFDRVVSLVFSSEDGEFELIGELMGKHSNWMLLDEGKKLLGAMKWLGPKQSKRPILPGQKYLPPPFGALASLLNVDTVEDAFAGSGMSGFLKNWLSLAGNDGLHELQDRLRHNRWEPISYEGQGAYPFPVLELIDKGVPRESFSVAVELHFESLQAQIGLERVQSGLLQALNRVLIAREVALKELAQAMDVASRAKEYQQRADWILAYQYQIQSGASFVTVWDESGQEITLQLNPELSALDNAEVLYKKAKKAKLGLETVVEQKTILEKEHLDLSALIRRIEDCTDLSLLVDMREEAIKRRWLHVQLLPTRKKEDRPFGGHSIREVLSPGGWRVLYGENSTSNDYLTTRVAKPNDYWLHVRGGPSAHVILLTQNKPEKVQRADLEFAALLAVRNSPQKHSSYVSVDYTLKKYVTKPRGSGPGLVHYSREKSLTVEGI